MATQKYTTLGQGTLASGYTAGGTSLSLSTGQGASFPSSGDFVVALDSPPSFFLKCTARTGDILTVATSAVDGTTASNKASGVQVTEVVTATVLDGIRSDIHQTGAIASAASEKAGNIYLPNDAHYLLRDTGSVFNYWGPLFPCTDPKLQTWTWVNQGGASRDDTKGGIFLSVPVSATVQFRILCKSSPSTPYTTTFGMLVNINGQNYQRAGVLFREASSGKVAAMYMVYNGAFKLQYDRYTNASGGGGVAVANIIFYPKDPIFFRLKDDGTNRFFYYSFDGVHFIQFYTELSSTSFTADQIGFFASDETNTYTCGLSLLHYLES